MAEQKDQVSEVKETKVTKEKPQSKKEKKQKNHKVRNFFRDLKAETKKITWFSKVDTIKSSALVIAIIVIFGAVLGLVDWGLSSLIALLANLV